MLWSNWYAMLNSLSLRITTRFNIDNRQAPDIYSVTTRYANGTLASLGGPVIISLNVGHRYVLSLKVRSLLSSFVCVVAAVV